MVVKKIDDNKIKVFISEEELKRFNVDFGNVLKMTRSANELFWAAMSQAEQQVNFRVDNAKLLVEANADEQNGFTMTITKVEQGGQPSAAQNIKPKLAEGTPPKVKRKNKSKTCSFVFRFENFDHVCMAMKQLDLCYLGESSLYKMEENFYLHISTKFVNVARKVKTVLSEYGSLVVPNIGVPGKLSEYGELMIDEYAIEKVATYF